MNIKLTNAEKKRRSKKYVVGLCVLAVAMAVLYFVGRSIEIRPYGNVSIDGDTPLGGNIINDQQLKYKNYLLTILFIGVDRDSAETEVTSGRNGGQADFLMLLVIDPLEKTVTQLHIDRDAMVEVQVLGPLGNPTSTMDAQICLAHGFGDGKAQSCELTRDAVRKLLPGVDINYYIALNMDAIHSLNDAVGGVTVKLEEDFSSIDPAMTQGAELKLSGSQAETFVRRRMDVGDGSNEARIARQKAFLSAFADELERMIAEDNNAIGLVYDIMGASLQSNLSRGRIINEANKAVQYSRATKLSLPGQHTEGEQGFIEFHVDHAALELLIKETFYKPID